MCARVTTTYLDRSDWISCSDSPPFWQESPLNLAFRARTESSKALLLGDLLAGSQQSGIYIMQQSHHLYCRAIQKERSRCPLSSSETIINDNYRITSHRTYESSRNLTHSLELSRITSIRPLKVLFHGLLDVN